MADDDYKSTITYQHLPRKGRDGKPFIVQQTSAPGERRHTRKAFKGNLPRDSSTSYESLLAAAQKDYAEKAKNDRAVACRIPSEEFRTNLFVTGPRSWERAKELTEFFPGTKCWSGLPLPGRRHGLRPSTKPHH